MKKLVGLFALLALLTLPALAQDSSTPPPDQAPTAPTEPATPVKVKRTNPTPKYEISGGFTYRTYYGSYESNVSKIGMYGGFGSFDYNIFRWLGVEGEGLGVTGTLKVSNVPPVDLKVFTILGGPKFYPFGHHKLTPFGHFLYGVGINTSAIPPFAGFEGSSNTVAVSAWEVGGGLDFYPGKHWGFRLVQYDYGSAKFLGNGVPNQGSQRLSFGVVYRFGRR